MRTWLLAARCSRRCWLDNEDSTPASMMFLLIPPSRNHRLAASQNNGDFACRDQERSGAATICKLSRPGRSGEIPHGNRRVGIIKLDVHVCDGGPERDESWQGGRQTSDGETQSVRVT